MSEIKIRDPREIQRVHDVLHEMLIEQTAPNVFGPPGSEAELAAMSALQTLCWVLEHDSGEAFFQNIRRAERELERRGFKLQPKPELPTRTGCHPENQNL